jgi:thymidylate synthase ThyX
MAEVIALAGWPPEVLAYAYAMYSRSALSIRESLKKVTAEKEKTEAKTSKFFDTYYFQYGHASIADNAHVSLALEDISQIAAFELEDEQLWDGQERSTRYQSFQRGGGYYIPASVMGIPQETMYAELAEFLLGEYEFFSKTCFDLLAKQNPKPAEMKDGDYERTLRARAFDISRYFLFGGILTSVGQITSARTLEQQISRLMSSEYPELRDIAGAMRRACTEKPHAPEGRDEPPVAPTLVKYTRENAYLQWMRKMMREYAAHLLTWTSSRGGERYTELAPPCDLESEIVATLLYGVSQYPYSEIVRFVANELSREDRQEILDAAAWHRSVQLGEGKTFTHPFSREFDAGYALTFDVLMDRGAARDLHRHRRCVQAWQPLTVERGFDTPEFLRRNGLEERYGRSMIYAAHGVRALRKYIGCDADYLIPFAFRCGGLYKMHFAQAAYVIELRSKVGGHFSYREAVCRMHEELARRYPELAKTIRVTPFAEENLLKR